MQKKIKKINFSAFFDQFARTLLFNHFNLFLVALKVSANTLGFANSIFNFFSSFAKQFTPLLLNKFHKKRKIIILAKTIIIFLIILLFFDMHIYIVIFVFSLIYLFDGIILVTRDSLFTEIINNKDELYAKLFLYSGFGALFALVVANAIFFLIPKSIFIIKVLFLIAGFFEFVSMFFIYAIKTDGTPNKKHSFKEQIQIIKQNKRFLHVLTGYSILLFSMFLISPFIVQYIIDYLKLSFAFFALFNIVFFIFFDIGQQILSKIHHSYLRSLLLIGSITLVLFPILFFLSENKYYLLFIQVIMGLAFAIMSYALLSYIVSIVDHKEKPLFIGSFYAITTIPAIFAPLLAGLAFSYFQARFYIKTAYILLFAISFVFRIISIYFFLKIPKTQKKDNIFYLIYKLKRHITRRHN